MYSFSLTFVRSRVLTRFIYALQAYQVHSCLPWSCPRPLFPEIEGVKLIPVCEFYMVANHPLTARRKAFFKLKAEFMVMILVAEIVSLRLVVFQGRAIIRKE